jgi:hypothetical protein
VRAGRKRWYDGVLDIPEAESGPVSIVHRIEPAGTTIRSGNMRTAIFGQRAEEIHYEEPTRWHTLSEEGFGVWMTDLPIEQRQMDELIQNKASGRVLVGGLGVGYAAVALAHRPRVKQIVVVERSQDIINLVWESTLAKVPDPSKLTIVNADLFDYLKARESFFTWGLFDIWQGDGETTFHTTVVPLRKLADGMVRTVECWNEDIMRAQLFQGMESRLLWLDHPQAKQIVGCDLDVLATDNESIYIQWAVPFWRWYRENKAWLTGDEIAHTMRRYVTCYGRPELQDGLTWLKSMAPTKRKRTSAALAT